MPLQRCISGCLVVLASVAIIDIPEVTATDTPVYAWTSAKDKRRFQKKLPELVQNPILTTRLQGFFQQSDVDERGTEPCEALIDHDYLRTEGGVCQTGYRLHARDAAGERDIGTYDDLIAHFAPLPDASMAVSFLAVSTSDLHVKDDRLVGHVQKVPGGYLVEATRLNTFGCGVHMPSSNIFFIETMGKIRAVAKERSRRSAGPTLCVD